MILAAQIGVVCSYGSKLRLIRASATWRERPALMVKECLYVPAKSNMGGLGHARLSPSCFLPIISLPFSASCYSVPYYFPFPNLH